MNPDADVIMKRKKKLSKSKVKDRSKISQLENKKMAGTPSIKGPNRSKRYHNILWTR